MSGPTFILDGSNLAWLGPGDGPALAPVDAIADTLRAEWPGCKVITVCDASLRHRLDPPDKAEHQRRTAAGTLVEAPADEDADAYILDAARRLEGCVVTRDLYRDRRAARAGIPMLRPALIGGAVILGDPKVFPSADSDRGEPLDPARLGARVTPPPLPGGAPVEAAAEEDEGDDEGDGEAAPEPPKRRSRKKKPAPEPDGAPEDEGEPEPPAPEPPPKPAPRIRDRRVRDPEPPPPARRPATTAPPGRTALGAFILLGLAAAVGAVAWWVLADDRPPSVGEPEPALLFVRNCRGWLRHGDDERIVFYPRAGRCATSIAELDPRRRLATVVDGAGPRTEGPVYLVVLDADDAPREVELTRGRPAAAGRPTERATARIVGVDGPGGRVALEVSPAADRPSLWVLRAVDGDVLGHAAGLAGLALGPDGAAALRHGCPAGCGTVHRAASFAEAVAAAEAPADAPADGPRWAGPAVFSPDGARLAVAEAFAGREGAVVIVDADGARRRLALRARGDGEVTGLAWTADGLYLGVGETLYATDPGGDGAWWPVTRAADRVAPARVGDGR